MEERLAAHVLSREDVIQHWLLNLAIECLIPIGVLFPAFRWPTRNAREIPNFQAEDYARNLLELFDKGMITLSSESSTDEVTNRAGVSQILNRFLTLPDDYRKRQYLRPGDPSSLVIDRRPEMCVTFKLTNLGGESWEKIADPNWNRFISASTTYPPYEESGSLEGEIISPDRDLLIAYMGWFPEIRREQIQLETIKWVHRSDAEVLYWKRLSSVYFVSFQVHPAEPRPEFFQQANWLWDWWAHTCYWYKKPWELPSWQALTQQHLT